MPKKIVIINTVYGTGSTGKITAGLYSLANDLEYETYVAYGRGLLPNDYNIRGIRVGNKLDFCVHVMSNFCRGNSGFASKYVTKKFLQWLDTIQPNLIHLHNIHGFYINVEMLFRYIKEHSIPVIWTLHDCWPFTGQCAHFDYANCDKWKSGCYRCPIFRTDYPYSLFKDNSKNNYLQKKSSFTNVTNLHIVTPSQWLANLVKESFLCNYPVHIIHNGINTDIFKPLKDNAIPSIIDKHNEYDLKDKKILLSVANVWDKRKGYEYMLKLSDDFNESNGYQIVLIGVSKSQKKHIEKTYQKRILALTRTYNQEELAAWYNLAYAYVNPTLQDNYPTTNIEAMACQTPVITFNTGGSPETLNGHCGIVVNKGDYQALKEAITNIKYDEIHSHLYEINRTSLNYRHCFDAYMQLYKEL